MSSLRRSRAWIGVVWIATSLACSSPPPPSAEGPFDAAKRNLAARGAGPEYQSYTVEERDSEYARGFRERASSSAELRELVFHGVFRPGHPKAAGAQQVDEPLLAHAFDPKPYAEYDVAEMVELGRTVKLRLRGLDDVRWFLHGEHDALVEARATADVLRFEFRRSKSGEAGVMPWRALAVDRDGVPIRVDQ